MPRRLGIALALAAGLGLLAVGLAWVFTLPLLGQRFEGAAPAAGAESSGAAQTAMPAVAVAVPLPSGASVSTTPPPAEAATAAALPPPWPLLSAEDMLAQRPAGGSWQLARWRSNPAVLVVQFPDLAQQGAALNRLAAWAEKQGAPRDRLLSGAELQQLIARGGDNAQTFFGGHNYRIHQLAGFYALAQRQGLSLTAEEARLRSLLEAQAWLPLNGAAPGQALISFTDVQADDPRTPQFEAVDEQLRESVLRHELSHAQFFTDRAYQTLCTTLWQRWLSGAERTAIAKALVSQGYDGRNEELLINEAQALLFHTADPRAFGAASFGLTEARLAELRQRFRQEAQAQGLQLD